MIRNDHLGVTSIIRSLGLGASQYENLIHYFRSTAWNVEQLRFIWIEILVGIGGLYKEGDSVILIADGVKEGKEGRKLPGVKRLHQESENVGKGEYIFGHMYGAVGVLMGNAKKIFCVPVSAAIHDGVNAIRNWENEGYKSVSHVVQTIRDSLLAASRFGGKCILLLDGYYLSIPAFEEWLSKHGTDMTIVTRAKKSAKAFEFPPAYSGKGRPKIRGAKVKLMKLFDTHADKFTELCVKTYGKTEIKRCFCVDLLWGEGLYQPLRFVLVKEAENNFILACTNLSFTMEQIIRLYSYRFKIETAFRSLKQVVGGFMYHFWCKLQPKLSRYVKNEVNEKAVENVTDERAKANIVACLKATEGFVMFSCIALGLLQVVGMRFCTEIKGSFFRWVRTDTPEIPSEAAVADFMRKTLFSVFHKMPHLSIVQKIRERQEKDIEDTDSYDVS